MNSATDPWPPPHDLAPDDVRSDPPDEEQPATTRAPIDWADLSGKEPPPRKWAIKGWLGYGHTTLLVGAGGIGKTLIAQQVASSLALGCNFIDEVTAPARVLMWACEDDHDELWRRQIAVSHWMRRGLDEFAGNLVIVPRHGLDNALVTTEYGKLQYTPMIERLREQANDEGAQVVILDNVGQLYGASENDRHAVTAFLNSLSGALAGKAILLLAHPSRGLNSEFSGSSAWENVARTRLYLGANLPDQQKGDDDASQDVRYLSRRKSNYSAKDYRKCVFRDGVLIPDEPQEQGGMVNAIRHNNADKTVLAGLKRLTELGHHPTDSHTTARFLPRLMLDYKLAEGLGKSDLADAMRRLILDGRLKKATVARDDKRNPLQGLVVTE